MPVTGGQNLKLLGSHHHFGHVFHHLLLESNVNHAHGNIYLLLMGVFGIMVITTMKIPHQFTFRDVYMYTSI